MAAIGAELFEPCPDGKPGERRIKAAKWPDPSFVDVGIRGDLSELDGQSLRGAGHVRRRAGERKFIDVVSDVMGRRHGDSTSASSSWARTSTGSRAAPTARPRRRWRSSPTACSARRSARTPSPAWVAAWRWTAGSARSWSSCTPTSCGSPPTRSSTRSPRPGTCSAARARCRWCCAASSPPGTGYGSQHSMDPAGVLTTAPGWRVVAPSNPFDYVGPDEHRARLRRPGRRPRARRPLRVAPAPAPSTTWTTCSRSARRRCAAQGDDVTVISYLSMVAALPGGARAGAGGVAPT